MKPRLRKTLLQSLMNERHLTREETIEALEKRAREMEVHDFTLGLRQLDRWLAGDVATQPRPSLCRVLEAEFGRPVERLLAIGDDVVDESSTPQAQARALDLLRPDGEDVNRREFLQVAVVAPAVLRRVLSAAGGEAMEFTRLAATSGVGVGTLDHLEAVLTELYCSYSKESLAEHFAVARAYRTRVQELIQGRHTLQEGRQLYVYAAWLDHTLAWRAHELGDALTGEAYAIDCFEHADQAGHGELCAWATDQMASIAIYANRSERAAKAARRGIERIPNSHPLAIRLRGQAARAHARLGQRDECENLLTEARDLYDRLPSTTPLRFGKDTRPQAEHALAGHPASSYIWLGDFQKAKRHAEQAVALHESASPEPWSPNKEAIARIDLGIALAELGEADEAIGQGRLALASPRLVDSVRSRAADLDATLIARHPKLPAAREFHEQYGELVRATP
jgi:tetratricopeptide (TPR) repeat protein